MNNLASKIWDDLNNHELTIEHPELPETIRQSVEETILNNPSRCLDPVKAKGQCLRMSDELMLSLAERGKEAFLDSKIIFTKKPYPHFWIMVDGWHIDLTARQFNSNEPCAKIWKHNEKSSHDLYFVQKGHALVLFQLVPFNESKIPAKSIKGFSLILRSKLKQGLELYTRIINQGVNNILDRESSFR